MNKFKIGDRVVILPLKNVNSSYPEFKAGDTGEITHIDNYGWVNVKTEKGDFFATPGEAGFDSDPDFMDRVQMRCIEDVQDE